MSKYSPQEVFIGTIKTLILLIILEIVTSALLPAIGIVSFKPEFNILIVLYLAFKLNVPTLPFLILLTQFIHGAFAIEGWAIGTFAGILVSLTVRFVKDLLDFSSGIITMIVLQISQLVWYLFTACFICIKISSFENFFSIIWGSFPESIFISLTSPIFFMILDRFWVSKNNSGGI